MSETEECGNCKFWKLRSDIGDRGGGYCVRYPPFAPSAWVRLQDEIHPSSGHMNDAWPMVSMISWCGEYQPLPSRSEIKAGKRVPKKRG